VFILSSCYENKLGTTIIIISISKSIRAPKKTALREGRLYAFYLCPSEEPEYSEDDYCAHHGHQEAVQIEPADAASHSKHGRQPSANNRTNNPKNAGQNEAATVIPRHDKFSDGAGDKTKDNPGDDTHSDALLQV
jgi:hypothetical protein